MFMSGECVFVCVSYALMYYAIAMHLCESVADAMSNLLGLRARTQ